MRVLFLDTALDRLTVGVATNASVVAQVSEVRATGHADRLVPAVAQVMAEAGLAFDDLDAVGCTIGPGTFTGVRAGVSAARALGLAASIPSVGVSTLEAIAAGLPGDLPVTVAMDARRDELYVQHFGPGLKARGLPVRMSVREACESGAETRLAGSGARLLRVATGQGTVMEGFDAPHSGALAFCVDRKARRQAGTGYRGGPDPLYLRPPDATAPGDWRRPPRGPVPITKDHTPASSSVGSETR